MERFNVSLAFLKIPKIQFKLLADFKTNYRKLQYREKVWGKFQVSFFPEKWFYIRSPNLAFSSLAPIFNRSKDSIEDFDWLQNKFIENCNIGRMFTVNLKFSLAFPKKWFCICWANLAFLSIVPISNHSEDSI